MPSDLAAIAVCRCVGCGRESDKVALKKLNTYSRAFSCLNCFLKYSNCSNCQHPRHAYVPMVKHIYYQSSQSAACHCGCTEYRHGLEAEFDRQFDSHTGKKPTLYCARGCGSPRMSGSLFCERCDREHAELGR